MACNIHSANGADFIVLSVILNPSSFRATMIETLVEEKTNRAVEFRSNQDILRQLSDWFVLSRFLSMLPVVPGMSRFNPMVKCD